MMTVLELSDETCHMPVARVRAECVSSPPAGVSSSITGTGGAGSDSLSTVAEGAATAALGVGGFTVGEWRNFHHTAVPRARTRATSRTITARTAVLFCFFPYS